MLRVGLELDMMARYSVSEFLCFFCIIYEDFDILEHHLKSCFFLKIAVKCCPDRIFHRGFFFLDSQLNF